MKEWWLGLSPRERLALRVLAGAAAVFVALQLIAMPLLGWRSGAQARAELAEGNFRLVAEAASIGGGGASGEGDATPVRVALREAAASTNVTLNFVNERPDGQVEAQAASTDPERLYAMLAALNARGVRVASADIARLSDDAREVRAQLTFAR